MVIRVERQSHIHAVRGQHRIGLVAFDEADIAQFVALCFGASLGQKIVLDVFGHHTALRADRAAQERQHIPGAGTDVGHDHSGPQRHGAHQFFRLLPGVAVGSDERLGHAVPAFRGLVSAIGLVGHLGEGGGER